MVDQDIMLGLLAEGWRSPQWIAALSNNYGDALKKCIALEEENDKLKARVAELESHLAATDPWREASKR
jgi:hypothetical protein